MRLAVLCCVLCSLAGCRSHDRADPPQAAPEPTPKASASETNREPAAPKSAPPGPTVCQKGHEFDLDLAAWKSRLSAAGSMQKRDAILGELGLDPIVDKNGAMAPATLSAVSIENAALVSDTPSDRIVTLRYKRENDEELGGAVRIAVLRTLPNGHWCSVGSDLEVDQDHNDSACLGVDTATTPPIAVSPVHLTSEKRHTLRVVRQNGHCDTCDRSGHLEVAFFDVRGFVLAKLFETSLYDTFYSGCPFGPVQETFGSVELVAGFPREIVTTSEDVCHAPDPELPDRYRLSCTPSATLVRYGFRNGKYEELAKATPKPPLDERLAIEDSDFVDTQHGAGWGNRCFSHLKNHRLEEARAACRRGLQASPSRATEGALHYNLALIAAEANDTRSACDELAKSLKLRPGDAATTSKQSELGC